MDSNKIVLNNDELNNIKVEIQKQPKVKDGQRLRNCMFTLLSDGNDQELAAWTYDKQFVKLMVYQYENCPTTNKLHIQGYVEFKKQMSFKQIKDLLGKRAHIERRWGTRDSCIKYCLKDNSRNVNYDQHIYGQIESSQGKRNDIDDFTREMKENGINSAIKHYPEVYVRYHGGFDKLNKLYKENKAQKEIKEQFKESKLRKWQKETINILSKQNDRQILWIYDKAGNNGKTYLAKYLVANNKAFYVMNGKSKDIAHAYNRESVVCFDFSRSQEDHINYGILEQLKNGMLFSSKYDSHTKIMAPPFIICFANFMPDVTKLSIDRWQIIELNERKMKILSKKHIYELYHKDDIEEDLFIEDFLDNK